jgi:hypothetical protein
MQTGLGLPSTSAKAGSKGRCFGGIAVVLLGLVVSACVSTGQLANLTETARPSIAFGSIDGPPSAVVPRFVTMLKEEAAQHQITVGSPGEVNYRLRGYLAVQSEGGTPSAGGPVAAPQRTVSAPGWLDDWTPEASGIFRIFGREPPGPATAAEARVRPPADDVPLPRGRPAPGGSASGAAIASATGDPAENSR